MSCGKKIERRNFLKSSTTLLALGFTGSLIRGSNAEELKATDSIDFDSIDDFLLDEECDHIFQRQSKIFSINLRTSLVNNDRKFVYEPKLTHFKEKIIEPEEIVLEWDIFESLDLIGILVTGNSFEHRICKFLPFDHLPCYVCNGDLIKVKYKICNESVYKWERN